MTYEEKCVRMSEILNEAADILNEAQSEAKVQRKKVHLDARAIKSGNDFKKFKSGTMEIGEAKKYKAKLDGELTTLKNAVAKIPNNTGKDVAARIIHGLGVTTVCGAIVSMVGGSIIGATSGAETFEDVAGVINTASAFGSGVSLAAAAIGVPISIVKGKNNAFSRQEAQSEITSFENKVNAIWTKYYANK